MDESRYYVLHRRWDTRADMSVVSVSTVSSRIWWCWFTALMRHLLDRWRKDSLHYRFRRKELRSVTVEKVWVGRMNVLAEIL